MERTELAVENNDLPRSPPDLAVEENDDLGFSEVAFDINKKMDKLVSLMTGGNSLSPPSQEPPTDCEGNLELLEILWKASGKLDVILLMSSKQ
ncbi:hypothetical protein Pyn_36256 [Prunus yedoensis var. nudiflora]|uniref:Uncharacterized protein n=1 Tax=Prunus yedoensis var. nudiflora TaxID=2094558 RepID=A0A314Y464_PRUYE|nr:hypothetical protein Pyn_06082 [Prunus yedoensis var. nudiflora]PQQ09613.1 hypothetical protein Pyn_36256 [Prunus yedoensis var. nudiflora]